MNVSVNSTGSNTKAAPVFFTPRRLTHLTLWVKDVDKVEKFYNDVVGIETVYTRDVIRGAFLSNGNTLHDLAIFDVDSTMGKGREPGLHHLGFELETEVDLVDGYFAAQEAGYKFDYTMSADVTHSIYASDPDGNSFELYADTHADWRTRRHGDVSDIKPDWKPGMTTPVAEKCYTDSPVLVRNEKAIFHPRRVSHATLVADDYAGVIDTYTKLAGLNILAGGPEDNFTLLGGTLREISLSIFRATPSRPAGVHHFGIEVWDAADLEQAKTRLEEAGIEIEAEFDHPLRQCLFIRDPDGKRLQFYVNKNITPSELKKVDEETALFLS